MYHVIAYGGDLFPEQGVQVGVHVNENDARAAADTIGDALDTLEGRQIICSVERIAVEHKGDPVYSIHL